MYWKFLVLEIIALELVAVNSPYHVENTCHRQSMIVEEKGTSIKRLIKFKKQNLNAKSVK